MTNPLTASGAADPESRDDARDNAPLTVLTLDRIVSLRDFEDFARAFAGVGKAQAVALWLGDAFVVHVTIAAAAATAIPEGNGGTSALATHVVDPTAPLFVNLVDAVTLARDPAQRFIVDSYQPLFFNVKAKVLVDQRHVTIAVLDAVGDALVSPFRSKQRGFGQPITAAEVVTVIQGVPGVVACDLDQLYKYQEGQQPPDPAAQITPGLLEADRVRLDPATGQIQPSQLLLINPAGITLEAMAL